MNFDLDIGQWLVIGLSAFFFVWYVLASSTNRKLGIAAYRWLRTGLSEFGEISVAEWIGASNMGARFTVKNAIKPFRLVEAHYLLEPREFLPYWLANQIRGKHDEVLVRITLRTAPPGNLEIQRSFRTGMKSNPGTDRLHPEFQNVRFDLKDTMLLKKIEACLVEYSEGVEKITLRREVPHLEIQARIKPMLRVSPVSYCKAVLSWFQDS
jgi:hypothetical protein